MDKKKLFLGFICLGCLSVPVNAQVNLVNPTPQSVAISQNSALMKAPDSWNVKLGKSCPNYIVDALSSIGIKHDASSTTQILLGLKNEKHVRKYKKNVPNHKEGYYLSYDGHDIVIVGYDEKGLFYGVQTLNGIMSEGKIEVCEIRDWPDVEFRGTVEGFYGTPWSHQARISQLEFYGRNKMNVYIYGPKDDPWHRDQWRVPYPEDEAKRIAELVNVAKNNGVNFYWAIHPGVDIKWTNEDRDALVEKFEKMYLLGVRSFAVFFDDIWGEGTKADKQAELLNYVDDHFIKTKPDVSPLVMCPTEYNRAWANDEKGYLRTLGTKMNQGIEIMWTGNSVVHCIDKESMDWINSRIARKAYIWWNFPVSDFVRDHILLGPAYGNGLDISDDMSGFVSNPMEHAEASKISLYGIADYTWNMKAYDYQKDWERGLKNLLPNNYEALRVFALYNKDLGPNGHGFRREEGDELKELATKVLNDCPESLNQFLKKCRELRGASNILLNDESNPRLVNELRPWLLQGKLLGEYGECVTQMVLSNLIGNDSPGESFEMLYKQARSLQKQMYELENSDVRHTHQPGIKVGTKVLLPTINKLFVKSVESYNANTHSNLEATAEYNPFKLSSDVTQLAQLPVTLKGNEISITPALEVINWQANGVLCLEGDKMFTCQGMDFNFGVPGMAKNFKLELLVDNVWKPVSLLHYSNEDAVIHTGNELSGMQAMKLRITNVSGVEQKIYFKRFSLIKR